MKGGAMGNRRAQSSLWLLLPLTAFAVVSLLPVSRGLGVNAFEPRTSKLPLRPPARMLSQPQTVQSLSNSNNNENNENNNENENNGDDVFDVGLFDLDLLARRLDKADKMEMRNDATLVACYVLCRFLVYDISSGAKIAPGWEIQDWIWLTGTFSSATVLVVYYVIAGLLSRTYESNTTFAVFGPSPVVRALVNVVLCCPVWLATEHLLHFGPADIGGDTLPVAVVTGFVGLGSFMAVAKTLTAGMR